MTYIEKKINDIADESAKKQLYKILTLHIYRYYSWDVTKAKTRYSYKEKMFINQMIQKYGKYHINDIFRTLYQMNLEELLPEILISVKDILSEKNSYVNLSKGSKDIIDIIIILYNFILYAQEGVYIWRDA